MESSHATNTREDTMAALGFMRLLLGAAPLFFGLGAPPMSPGDSASASNNAPQGPPQPPQYYNPDWSPDSKRITFESTRDGKFSIYTVGRDGSGLRRLTVDTVNNEQPRWSPDGRRIVFISDRDGHDELYLMNADGSDQTRLTSSPTGDFYQASFSRDGRWIAFQGRYDPSSRSELLFVIRPDGSGRRQLTDSMLNSVSPHWSPDGRWLAFTMNPRIQPLPRGSTREAVRAFMRERDAAQEIAVIRADGTALRRLTGNAVNDCCPRWSADGRELYFMSTRDSAEAIYAIRPDGGGLRRIVAPAKEPIASPDGRTVYFVSTEEGAGLFAMDPDGSHIRRLADAAVVPGPELSRDGRYFAYTKTVDGRAGVYIFDIANRKERLVAGGL